MGHNAFLRWSALQDAAFVDAADGKKKIWSESNVSEDFDMAMRLQVCLKLDSGTHVGLSPVNLVERLRYSMGDLLRGRLQGGRVPYCG